MPAQSLFTYLEPRSPAEDEERAEPPTPRPKPRRFAALLRRLFRRD